MSKTVGNIVDPFGLVERYGADAVRFYFLREISPFKDGDFTEEKFIEAHNAGLANGLGNYVSRVAKMIEQYFGGVLSRPSAEELSEVKTRNVEVFWVEYTKFMESYQLKQAMDVVWRLISELDSCVQKHEPFKTIKTDPERTKAVLWNLASGALNIGWMLKPFMPDTADKILDIFGADSDSKKEWKEIKVKLEKPLFARK